MTKKRVFTILLAVLMVFAMMPSAAFAADGETVNYNLWVGDTRVTSDTMSGEGWSFETDSSGGTLTLTNASITETHSFGLTDQKACIFANNIDFELTIRLVGKNSLSAGNEGKAHGIYLDDDLTVTGDGSLDIDAGQHGIDADAITFDNTNVRIKGDHTCIYANGANDIVINGGKVELTSDGDGAYCGTLKTSNNAELNVKTGKYGLQNDRAEITDSILTLETAGEPAFYSQTGKVIIENSEVIAKTSRDYAIECYSEDCYLEIIGSKVTAESNNNVAIYANTLTIEDGSGSIKTYVEAKTSSEKEPAVFSETADGITLKDGIEIKTPEGGSVGSFVYYGTTGSCVNDQNGNRADHVIIVHHDLELTKGVEPACEEPGTSDYYTCNICGKFFSDEYGRNEISEDSWILPASGHDWGEWETIDEKQHKRVCTHDSTHTEQEDHIWDAGEVTKEATENEEGIRTFTCTVCGSTRIETIPKLEPAPDTEPTPAPQPVPSTKVNGTLLAKITAKGSKSLILTWNKIKGAEGYDIFFVKCSKNAPKKVKTIKGNKTFKWTKSGLKKRTAYKAYVKAYVMKNGKKTYLRKSPMVHAYTSGGTKFFTNSKSVTVKKTKVSLKAGKTYKIKASVTRLSKGKKLMPANHAPKLRYVSSNKKIATVSRSGKITAKSKGSCKIYVIAVNGAKKTVAVTVR